MSSHFDGKSKVLLISSKTSRSMLRGKRVPFPDPALAFDYYKLCS